MLVDDQGNQNEVKPNKPEIRKSVRFTLYERLFWWQAQGYRQTRLKVAKY